MDEGIADRTRAEGPLVRMGHDPCSSLNGSHSSSVSSLTMLPNNLEKPSFSQQDSEVVKELYPDEPGPHNRKGISSPSTVSPLSIEDVDFLGERVHCLESEKLSLMIDHNNLIREFNKRMESHLEEIRALKELNSRLYKEASDLQDLACYLDDDRQKCRKLAKEWQRFGKYTLAVMRNEVISYQEKLGALEDRQMELIKENGDLRDLCIYLDGQRVSPGNGSADSSSLRYTVCPECASLRRDENGSHDGLETSQKRLGKKLSAEYVGSLENQVQHLEKEKDALHKLLLFGSKKSKDKKKKVSFSFPDDDDSSSTTSDVGQLDYPPSFGSIDSFSKMNGHYDGSTQGGILRQQGAWSHVGNQQQLDFTLKRSLSLDQRRNSSQARRINALREKLLLTSFERQSTRGHHDQPTGIESLNSDEQRYRSDSDMSASPEQMPLRHNGDALNQSADSSSDLQSPISPPPSTMNVSELFEQASSRGWGAQMDSSSRSKRVISHPPVVLGNSALTSTKALPPSVSEKSHKAALPPGYEEALEKLNVDNAH